MAGDPGHVARTPVTDEERSLTGRSGDRAEQVEVVVVGSGPLGFMVAAGLARRVGVERVVTVDREPWFAACAERIDRLQLGWIDDRSALADALRMVTRSSRPATDGTPLGARTTLERCRHGVEELGLGGSWRPARLAWLVPIEQGRATLVQLADGTQLRARHVVLAPGSRYRVVPHWVDDLIPQPADRLIHTDDLDLRSADLAGEHVVVVGADLPLHLAMSALRRGAARAEVISDGPLAVQGGGTVQGDPATGLLYDGQLRLRGRTRIIAAARAAGRSELMLGDEQRIVADRVWLATGTQVDLRADRSLRFVRELLPAADAGPMLLDDELRWPGSNVHFVGAAATRAGADGRPKCPDRVTATQLVVRSIERSLGVCGSRVGP